MLPLVLLIIQFTKTIEALLKDILIKTTLLSILSLKHTKECSDLIHLSFTHDNPPIASYVAT